MNARLRNRVAMAVLAVCASACDGRPEYKNPNASPGAAKQKGPKNVIVDLSAGVPEVDAPGMFGLPGDPRSFDALVESLRGLRRDGDVKGIFVRLGSVEIGAARAGEIGDALFRFRDKGIPVHCHAESLSNATLMLATRGCARISITPAGEVEAVGLAAQVVYLRKLLVDELKLSVDILQVGKFKGAEEPLTRDGPSDEARASLESVFVDLRKTWLEQIGTGRASKEGVRAAAEDGPYGPKAAKEKGLIDDIAYADEALHALEKQSGVDRSVVSFGKGADSKSEDFGQLVRALAGEGATNGPVALVRASGSISMAGGSGLFGGRSGINERSFDRIITKLAKDDSVKAVVLRIDSPGGSALASDLMWHELMKLRAKKPLVVSVGDMAASGGYYMACTANVIFADPMSIVGSIGVVGGKIAFGPALERFGVHAETFAANKENKGAGSRAAYMSPLVPWDEATKKRVLDSMTGVYDLFLSRVAEGRKTTVDKVAAVAEGRIFSGTMGKQNGLVDELGGLEAAIAKAKELAALPEDAEVCSVEEKPAFLDALEQGPEGASERVATRVRERTSPVQILREMAPDLAPFAGGLLPLNEGERAVVSLPYAVTVR